MLVYRIVQSEQRVHDLSGTGAFMYGGRWNNPGTFVLYTSENRSLALLETLVHFDEEDAPPNLYILELAVPDSAPIYNFPDKNLPADWREPENIALKGIGDLLMRDKSYIGCKVRSAVLTEEYNILLNPLYPAFNELVKVISVMPYMPDARLYY